MTHATKRAPRLAAISAAALAALLLAGCSTGHIGETWQCPLAEGGSCDSVAAADPAVPDPGASDGTVLREPLWRVRAGDRTGPAADTAAPCETRCDGFDPFAWLAGLFGAQGHEGEARPAGPAAQAASAAAAQPSDPEPGAEADAPAEPAATLPAKAGPSQDGPARDGPAAALPAAAERAGGGPHGGGLRTGEVVARIWIAPFVDANGVYREASHVRVVLEPAGWRLP